AASGAASGTRLPTSEGTTTSCDVRTTLIVVTAESAVVTSRASINSPYFRRRTAKRLTLKELPICSAPRRTNRKPTTTVGGRGRAIRPANAATPLRKKRRRRRARDASTRSRRPQTAPPNREGSRRECRVALPEGTDHALSLLG